MTTDQEYCTDCIGTGIGWYGQNSHCPACNGAGFHRQPALINEDSEEPWNVDLGEDTQIKESTC